MRAAPLSDYEGNDVFSVERLEDGTFVVRHFEEPKSRKVCCKLQVDVTDKDRDGRTREEAEIHALTRAAMAIDRKHGRADA